MKCKGSKFFSVTKTLKKKNRTPYQNVTPCLALRDLSYMYKTWWYIIYMHK